MKKLDQEAFEYMKERRKNGAKYTELEQEMFDKGYRSPTGMLACRSMLSNFMCKNGNRSRTINKKKNNKSEPNFDKQQALEIITKERANGKSAKQIARILNNNGLTLARGSYWSAHNVNFFGRSEYTRNVKQESQTASSSTLNTLQSKGSSIVEQILASNLAKDIKLKLIEREL